jgi:wyosine [tRNA(Phe)-imidazoG37] synthetase (radical SAM superfamily)
MSTILIESQTLAPPPMGLRPIPEARSSAVQRLNEKDFRLSWVMREFAGGITRIVHGQLPGAPLQIEIHPYHCSQPLPCNNRCVWCTQLEDKTALKADAIVGIEPANLIKFIASLKGSGIRRIVLSGNSTEPLLYPRIEEVIRAIHAAGLNWVLYTNLYYGQKMLNVALDCSRPGDVLRVSLDAGNETSYMKTHRPQNDPQAFRIVTANLTELLRERAQRQSPLAVGIAYLMTECNSTGEELREAIQWAEQIGVDFMRFSVPLQPTHQNSEFALPEDEAGRIKRRISRLAWDYEIRRERYSSPMRIVVRQDEVIQGPKPFLACHHCKLIPVVGVRGKIYPCTSTSTADFDHLGIGDINQADFAAAFWDIWNDPTKWRHDVQNCPDCTRFEYDLNAEMDRRLALEGDLHSIPGTWTETRSGTNEEMPTERVLEDVV